MELLLVTIAREMFKELQEKNIDMMQKFVEKNWWTWWGISIRTNLGIPGRARKTFPGTTFSKGALKLPTLLTFEISSGNYEINFPCIIAGFPPVVFPVIICTYIEVLPS